MSTELRINPPVIAHRGASAYAPENTLAAFKRAFDLGMRWVEFDVMLSADGLPIVFHDETLNRTTNAKGELAPCDYSYLATLDAGRWFDASFTDERIPTLDQVLLFLKEHDMSANVEIKPLPGRDEQTAETALKSIEAVFPQPHSSILFSSFSVPALRCLRRLSPQAHMGLLIEEWTEGWEKVCESLNCLSLHVDDVLLNQYNVNKIKKLGLKLLCYTVNQPERARQLFDWGVDAVFSDAPDRILSAILV